MAQEVPGLPPGAPAVRVDAAVVIGLGIGLVSRLLGVSLGGANLPPLSKGKR